MAAPQCQVRLRLDFSQGDRCQQQIRAVLGESLASAHDDMIDLNQLVETPELAI
jgi:hypothetical protein